MDNFKRVIIVTGLLILTKNSTASEFDTSLLVGNSAQADMSRFYTDDKYPVGQQLVDVYINTIWKGQFLVELSDQQKISMKLDEIKKLGLNIPESILKNSHQDQYIPIDELFDKINYQLNFSEMKLDISMPQIYIKKSEQGSVDPEFWSHGINALILSYNSNYYSYSEHGGSSNESFFTTLNTGFNFESWQFRDESNYSYYSNGDSGWKNNSRYIYRPISKIMSGLTIGDFYTPADVFSSIKMRGIALGTEKSMLPNSSQSFVPVIRGIAQTNALVGVYQNGNLIYQENVPAGEFVFDDIQPSSGSGDLSVVIQEADGQKQSFSVPYSSVPNMLKQGVFNYNAIVGQAKLANTFYQPDFIQGEYHIGVNNLVTLYTGGIVSKDYHSAVLGSGWNFGFGAISADVTHAVTELDTGKKSGQSYRLTYSKYINATSTNFSLATYRYSTRNFYSFTDAIYTHDNYRAWQQYRDNSNNDTPGAPSSDISLISYDALRGARAKNTFTLNLNQRLPENYGYIYISGTQRDYWNSSAKNKEYQLGYSNTINDISFGISVSHVKNYQSRDETRYFANISIPITIFEKRGNINVGSYFTDDKYQQTLLSVSGVAGKGNQLNYSLSASNQPGNNNLIGGNLSYRYPYSTLSASATEARSYRQAGLGARGTAVVTANNILFSGDTGQTYTIINAPMADNYMVNSDRAAVTNKKGLVLISSSIPYRTNSYTLGNTDESSGADLMGNMAHITPYQGSVNYIELATDTRQTFIFRANLPNNENLPFGAEVLDSQKENVGYVGQSGVLYIKSKTYPDILYIKTNAARDEECIIRNPIDTMDKNKNICRGK
ncbi:fimbria/pilus outer membrane usher protein [Klebsiella sp. BIGb0407]|uniref:fimbria/pilus outer membrane usher protein n=1 Tax=Klebsiella sp. BIGb0407 TaxID=2940603 RepID=UPI0021688DA2|nr:fimbria/pilus outer membrane usher protein [Klebsiella sp. BIGb0407]